MRLDVYNQRDLVRMAALQSLLYEEDLGRRQDVVMQAAMPEWDNVTVRYTTGNTPAVVVATDPENLLILIGATNNILQVQQMFQGAFKIPQRKGNVEWNQVMTDALADIKGLITSKAIILPANVVVCGYSYGGAIAHVLAALLLQPYTGQQVSCFTMGAPRFATDLTSQTLHNCGLVRVMNIDDPVPYTFPHFDDAPFLVSYLGPVNAVALQRWIQPGGGWTLDLDGKMTSSVLPRQPLWGSDVALTLWGLALSQMRVKEHFIGTYLDRLSKGVVFELCPPIPHNPPACKGAFDEPELCPPILPLGPGMKGEVFLPLDPADVALGPVLGPLSIAQKELQVQSVYIPVPYRFRVVPLFSSYAVDWMGYQVAKCGTKSQARTYCKYANKWLRIQQGVQNVDHTAFGNALQAYLVAAATSGLGFQPILNVI